MYEGAARVIFFVPVLLYSGKVRQCYGGRRRSLRRFLQMDNLRGLLGVRRMKRVPNAWNRKLCGIVKGLRKLFSGAWPYFKKKE